MRAMNGNAAHAVPVLRHLMQTPIDLVGPRFLQIDPSWDPIRSDPGFKALALSKTSP